MRKTNREINEAARRFAAFHDVEAESVETRAVSLTGFLLGKLDAVTYTVVENGKLTTYHHEFDTPPGLAISHDGKTAIILAGRWSFTKRGFEG